MEKVIKTKARVETAISILKSYKPVDSESRINQDLAVTHLQQACRWMAQIINPDNKEGGNDRKREKIYK